MLRAPRDEWTQTAWDLWSRGDYSGLYRYWFHQEFSSPYASAATGAPTTGGGTEITTPNTTTDNAVVRWDGTGGTRIQDSGVIVDDAGNTSGIPTLTLTTGLLAPQVGPSGDADLLALAANLAAVNGAFGVGTTTVPHGGVGWATLAIDGANTGAAGPHVQFTTATDNYPLFQLLNYAHNNVAMLWDCYFDGAFKSSVGSGAGACFGMREVTNALRFMAAANGTAGSAVTLVEGFRINSDATLTATGILTLLSDLRVAQNIGLTADTDLIQLAANAATVNGTLTVTSHIYSGLNDKHYFGATNQGSIYEDGTDLVLTHT